MISTCAVPCGAAAADRVEFGRRILPLLARSCFDCHGPDEQARQAELRLDTEAGLRAALVSGTIVAGEPAHSKLYNRLTTDDDNQRMPPVDSAKGLSGEEIELIRLWIEQGAHWEQHWSFVPPVATPMPAVESDREIRNPIDRFVRSRFAQLGLRPSPPADRATLIRRVTLDLTGLPPTPEEVDAFVADPSCDAYEKVVDRLLASPHYGERMAIDWLDAARYADTHGYLFDTERAMWRWRDWVIEAFNQNLPFDQFTVQQLAGDLLPEATLDDQIATGFHRNHIINNEAGANPQEYLVENVLDRVNTTATVWLGLTLACCQCHDHKYDPFSQREYYELYAFFNTVPEAGLDGLNSNAKPLVQAPTSLDRHKLAELQQSVAAAQQQVAALEEQVAAAQSAWERTFTTVSDSASEGLAAHWPLDNSAEDRVQATRPAVFEAAPAAYATGILGHAAKLDGLAYLNAGDRFNFADTDSFSLAAWVRPSTKEGRLTVLTRMQDAESLYRGYALQLVGGLPAFFLVNSFPDRMIQVQGKTEVEPEQWHHLAVTYDGSGKAAGVKLFVDGVAQAPGIVIDQLAGPIKAEAPFWIGNGHPGAKFKGLIDDVRLFDRVVADDDIQRLPGLSIDSLIASEPARRTDEQARRIRERFLCHESSAAWREPYQALRALRDELQKRERTVPTVMVMQQEAQPRETRMLVRGAFDRPGDPVAAATPAVLPAWNEAWPKNRLGLAQWLVDPGHPLTARVAVNRLWQLHFGQGLVRTVEDFGIQGERPSHPELLDWLAVEFIRSGWDVKALQRRLVTSATYQQSSHVSAELRERDPDNRWLARGPRHRLPAELLRDQALFVSGLLVSTIGGPSVKPYQPEGLWREVAFDFSGAALTAQVYKQDAGHSLYRKSMYTFWKRTAPPPALLLFDAPDRERCVVRRERTNTPLQALVLMNDPTYIEAARQLAARVMTASDAEPTGAERISYAFRIATARQPEAREIAAMVELFQRQRDRFTADSQAAEALLAVGESSQTDSLAKAELAAYTVVMSVILNLDETITKR